MGAPVRISRRARRDVRETAVYIARDNPARAETFAAALLSKANSLGNHPRMGRVVPEFDDEAIREIIHGAYRILYKVTPDPDRVFILRFWHGARGNPQIVED